jgi:hypothetical protein
MKFSIGVIYEKLLRKQEFREDQVSDSLTLLKGINELLHVSPCFMTDLGAVRSRSTRDIE